MTIEFDPPKPIAQAQTMLRTVAQEMMRSRSREFDENEGSIPWDYVEFMHTAMRSLGGGSLAPREEKPGAEGGADGKPARPPIGYQLLATQIETLSWGDVGMYLITPGGGLGAAAVQAAGTPEQKAKFLARFSGDKPTFAAMSMTEAGAGSDTSAIRTRAVLDENPDEVARYLAGKEQLLQFFVGQLMKRTRGKANPKVATDAIRGLLETRRAG